MCLFSSAQSFEEEGAAHAAGKDECQIQLIFPCANDTAEGHMFKENFFVDMCCDKGVYACEDEADSEHIVDTCRAGGHLQRQPPQYAVPDAPPVEACVDADDEIEQHRRCEMRAMHIDGDGSAQTDDGGRIERDEDACHNDDHEETQHDGVDNVERRNPQSKRHECAQIAAHQEKMCAAEQEKDQPQILVIIFGGQKAVRQKQQRCPDENVEKNAHQLVYPSETSQLAT